MAQNEFEVGDIVTPIHESSSFLGSYFKVESIEFGLSHGALFLFCKNNLGQSHSHYVTFYRKINNLTDLEKIIYNVSK